MFVLVCVCVFACSLVCLIACFLGFVVSVLCILFVLCVCLFACGVFVWLVGCMSVAC